MISKSFLYAVAVMAVMTACTAEDCVPGNNNLAPSEKVVDVSIMAPTLTTNSRGTGTVGSTDPTQNQWKGQTLRLYMFDKGTLNTTMMKNEAGFANPIYSNALVYAPDGVSLGVVKDRNGGRHFYPIEGASDFWSYRTDGAETSAPQSNGTQMYVPFTIDGSQDLMVGKTDDSKIISVPQSQLYSAKSARLGVTPTLEFKHELTRLTFEAKAYEDQARYSEDAPKIGKNQVLGNETDTRIAKDAYYSSYPRRDSISLGIFIDSLMIESVTTGRMVFAFTPQAQVQKQYVEWDENSRKFLTLKERPTLLASDGTAVETQNLQEMTMTLVPASVYKKLGEALLVAPAEKYKLSVAMHQYVTIYDEQYVHDHGITQNYKRQEMIWPNDEKTPHVIDLSNMTGHGQAGYSYKIQLGVSGLEIIQIDGMLTNWQDGGSGSKDLE